MSGHSKWANIKHKKEKTDAQKGKLFTKLTKEIIMAAKEGGGDPNANSKLRDAIAKAKAANMPSENITRAIKRGTGELEGVSYESITYEGYGPGGVAIIVEALTDNRNRTAGEMRHLFDRGGGSLGAAGCVSWMFERKGVISIEKSNDIDSDELMLKAIDAGAEDFSVEDEDYEIITDPSALYQVKEALEQSGYNITSAEISLIPQNTVKLEGEQAIKALKLIETLDDHDDVQNVYHNLEITDEMEIE
ncbi:DNA-binding regulatory protein, YebC/PmpR family [Caldanaerobius fijiensis DSM 17918]|uniref:Probable transcriptional regulatory protein SAMN02746089_00314 n=1 Tax=Caldanaerobius fijiensis DSM 17918 TaxID=1121256 RepID=A0A1M4TVW7_9THEO|nr:YebC/PmpR family DNA-binding transcriptional regulator [Caldanaerobius fijiensis]SHE48566.1 DNA-binding regulatory protein, YebC/PmpR family [Caldanaerobius fijiensis DSM 17918]